MATINGLEAQNTRLCGLSPLTDSSTDLRTFRDFAALAANSVKLISILRRHRIWEPI
jgi:hypothetical protein